MPSSPSVRVSSLIRLPPLQTASPGKKEQSAAAIPAAPAQDCSFAQPSPWVFPVAEELPTATVACLKVLNHILLEDSPATAAPFDLAESRYDGEPGTHSAGGDRTSDDKGKKVGCDSENKTQVVLPNSSKYAKRSRDNGVPHAERTSVATNGSVGGSGRRDHEVYGSEESSKGLGTRPRGITKSYASMFKLLHAAGVLNTLPKCLHMLHAVCILADQHRHTGTPTAASDQESPPGAFVCSPKRRKLAVDSDVVVQTVGGGAQAHECDGRHGSTCDANTDSGSLAEQREMRYLLTAAPLSPEHATNKHADNAETVFCNSDVRESFSQGAQVGVGSLPNDCESPAVCWSGRAHTQESSGGRRQATHLILHRQTRTAHIAGLVLGCIEALEAPPPLSDPTFHEKVLHVLCRLFYTVHPLEGKHSTAHEAPTPTPATRVSEDNDGAAVNGSGLNNKKATGSFGGLTNQLFDAYGEGKRLDRSTSHEGRSLMPLPPHNWRQQIVARFDTVERLLLCSVPTLFLGETASTAPATEQGTLGTLTRSVDAVTGGAEADEDPFPDSEDVGACCGGSAATTGTADRLRDLDKGDIEEPDARAGPALKRATSAAVLLQGGERCRRALRMVRRWVAFLLELEQERQTLVQRVLQASEEVQGLPHMLLQDRCEAEQEAQQLNMKNPGQSCSSTTTSKRRTLLILGTPREGGATQDHHKHELEKEAPWIERGVGPQSEEGEVLCLRMRQLEIRIRATRQLLLLPSIPPFTRPEVEAVHTARARFERCLLRWREAQGRRRQEKEEARKKAAAAAAAVAYVTDRMQEQQQAQAAAFAAPPGTAASATALLRLRSISHAFYLLGLNPQTATSQMVEQVRKKWRVLLHPDKFVSVHSHLLQQATEAFKAFHVAVTEANRILSQRRVEPSWSPPPPPPDLTSATHSAAAAVAPVSAAAAVPQHARNETQQTPVKGAADATAAPASCGENSPTETHKSCCPLPTHQFFPDVTVQASRSKKKACTGGLVLHVHAAPPREGEWPFAVIKEIRVFVLRPTLSEGPLWKLLPSRADVCLVLKKSVELKCAFQTATGEPSASAVATGKNGACPTNKVEIDALQPIELGVEKVYWVGVQVEGLRKSQSLVTWKPVTVCLALPEDADNNAPPHLDDSSSSSSSFDGDKTLNEANVGCRSFSAANRALLAFLQTFVETPFVKEDCSFNGRLRDSIASLRRVLRQQKKIKRSEHTRECRQDTDEWRWVEDEAKEVLRECMEKARTWESEEDKETMASATG